jgi:uncharacterized integral membrane protein
MTPKLVAILVLCAALLTFIVQNAEVVAIRFLFWEVQASLVIVIGSVALAGTVVGFGLASFARSKGRGADSANPVA